MGNKTSERSAYITLPETTQLYEQHQLKSISILSVETIACETITQLRKQTTN